MSEFYSLYEVLELKWRLDKLTTVGATLFANKNPARVPWRTTMLLGLCTLLSLIHTHIF